MSKNTLAKPVLSEIPEEEQQTTEGDEHQIVKNSRPKISLPKEIFQTSEKTTDGPGQIGRKSSDDTPFMISHNNHTSKPTVKFEITLAVNLYQIKEVFEKVCKKKGFEIVDDEGDQLTALNKKMFKLKDLILSCIPGSSLNSQNLTAVRLHSRTNKITCVRRITLKTLLGDSKLANELFADFEKELETHNGRRASFSPIPNGVSFFTDHVLSTSLNLKGSKYLPLKDEVNFDFDDGVISAQNLETSSIYEFRKILSSEQYSIGKKVAEFVRDFAASYKSIQESAELLPQPMESVYLLVNEVTETFFADFNYGKSETKQMLPFCRLAVEKYMFDKVYTQLFPMYLTKFEQQIKKFDQKAQKIVNDTDLIAQLKYLDIPIKFWLIPADNLDKNDHLIKPLEPENIPYYEAINEFSKIFKLKSPREKLGVLLMMHSLMKAAVVDFHKGKEEMCSMDEELPIMIYILLRARLQNGVAEFNFVDDYVQFDPSLESEKRLMTNLKVSLQYIADEWAIN